MKVKGRSDKQVVIIGTLMLIAGLIISGVISFLNPRIKTVTKTEYVTQVKETTPQACLDLIDLDQNMFYTLINAIDTGATQTSVATFNAQQSNRNAKINECKNPDSY